MNEDMSDTEEADLPLDEVMDDVYKDLVRTLQSCFPSMREASLAITKIEEASMWTAKAFEEFNKQMNKQMNEKEN